MERQVLTDEAYRWSEGLSRSTWWLAAKKHGDWLEVLTLDGGDTLPVFSGEDEAGLFLWLRQACDRGWEVRKSSADELVSVLCGSCSHARLVVLDPTVEILDGKDTKFSGLSREDFVGWMTSGSRRHY